MMDWLLDCCGLLSVAPPGSHSPLVRTCFLATQRFFFGYLLEANQRVRSRGNFRTINVRGPQTTRGIIISKGLLSRSSQLLAANRKQPFNQYPS